MEWPFEDDHDPDWLYCKNNAAFLHKEACEFILHIGDPNDEDPFWEFVVNEMKQAGCSPSFIATYIAAKDMGALRVMFWS